MIPRSRVSSQIRKIRQREQEVLGLAPKPEKLIRKELPAASEKEAMRKLLSWFEARGWQPHAFQKEAWQEFLKGKSGLISVPTGSGKTLAAMGGPLLRLIQNGWRETDDAKIKILYISPVKALTRDVRTAIDRVLRELDLPFRVELRTGDTTSVERNRIKRSPPEILITTPESLALMTTESGWRGKFSDLEAIIIDEWHELYPNKRGSLLELTLSRLRDALPFCQTWAVSATVGNQEEAAKTAAGTDEVSIVNADIERDTEISVILPEKPAIWFGSAGLKLAEDVANSIDPEQSTLIFTNTRAQSELWYQALKFFRPDWEDILALHHGSLEKSERHRVENGVKDGSLKVVVATSSLDLGVDFPEVKKVIQIGSVKSVARALQRSGRSEHRPGQQSRMAICPTNLLEVLEARAIRSALQNQEMEEKHSLFKPLDILVQFLLNCALDEGFRRKDLEKWIHGARSFRKVSKHELDWALNFVSTGGPSLSAYPEFRKLECIDGKYSFVSTQLAHLHRMNVGTIVSSAGILVQFMGGKKIGTVDEGFITRLKPGDIFQFSGKDLQLIRIRDMVALVRLSKSKKKVPAVWGGQAVSLSPILARRLRQELGNIASRSTPDEEIAAVADLLEMQRIQSHLPNSEEILIERWQSNSGYHVFIYLFEGRSVHEGIGHLMAFRLSQNKCNTISVAVNDYGLELLSAEPLGADEVIGESLLRTENLNEDIQGSLNFPEMVRRTFREIARVAGLVQQTAPGREKSVRQVQMGTGLLFDVLKNYDPQNLLLKEAYEQARNEQLDFLRLEKALIRAGRSRLVFREIHTLTPLSFPLFVERTRSQVSTETLHDRVERMQKKLFGDLHAN